MKVSILSKTKNLHDENEVTFKISQLREGSGVGFVHSLRKIIMADSLPGFAIHAVKIENKEIKQEFGPIPGLRENYISLITNLDKVVFASDEIKEYVANPILIEKLLEKKNSDHKEDNHKEIIAKIEKSTTNKSKIITAKDIKCEGGIEIENKDRYLATLAPKSSISICLFLSKGVGFVTRERNREIFKKESKKIFINSDYSPIKNAYYHIDGESLEQSKEIYLTIETNGSISPFSAISIANSIILSQHTTFAKGLENELKSYSLDILGITDKQKKSLSDENISLVSDLISKTIDEIKGIKGINEKDIIVIKEKLSVLNLHFKKSKKSKL